jgi:hypothetical protein
MSRLARMWCAALVIGLAVSGCGSAPDAAPLKELQKVRSGDVDVVLLSETGTLAQGKNSFVLEFRSPADGTLRDVGTVRANATMPMAGMAPMFGTLDLRPSGTPGRYLVNGEFGMTGTWQIKVEWQGGSATLSGAVR